MVRDLSKGMHLRSGTVARYVSGPLVGLWTRQSNAGLLVNISVMGSIKTIVVTSFKNVIQGNVRCESGGGGSREFRGS